MSQTTGNFHFPNGNRPGLHAQPHTRRGRFLHGEGVYAGAMAPSRQPKPAPAAQAEPRLGELVLIDRIRARVGKARSRDIQLGIGDDCAILRPRPGEEIVVTTDLCLEGRHFRRDWHSPASVGHRTLGRGLSDLAAMGARPVAAFLSLALPKSFSMDPRSRDWLNGFLDGLLGLATRTGVTLAGGDTAQAPGEAILADIVLLGAVPTGRALRRSGARAGDRLFCTGALGGAAAELRLLQQDPSRGLLATQTAPGSQTINPHPQLFPAPRLRVGLALVRRSLATAAMDLSDGLSTDLGHLCDASGLHAEISLPALPLHPLAGALDPQIAQDLALNGGEDYDLLFTVAAGKRVPRTLASVHVTEIGCMLPPRPGQPRVTALAADGTRTVLKPGGWEHLR